MDGPPANDWCSICHNNFDVPCQANCSHWFCGNCILQVWNHGSTFQPCLCPLCRRQITLLVPTESSSQQRHDPEVSEILGKVETYNRMFGQRSDGLIQRLQDLPFLLRRLLREMMDPQRSLPLVIRARVYLAMIISAIYIVSPVDIIPEGVLGVVGLLDDFIIALICFLHVAALYSWQFFHIIHAEIMKLKKNEYRRCSKNQ
ncbi:E3 ubiquitin-protein ligase RNF170 [Heracleum sosnowskyi]|uniref:E3 ubiquitin-protein ligase RNF170 n=1 Tax=Heracleum sosnowskyi TaxID=360622 RepID=A0AAD8IH26_9APIA|nr:E3 ubiquitin-protein ligase RNF170 [Heracleum sosnowskyi]